MTKLNLLDNILFKKIDKISLIFSEYGISKFYFYLYMFLPIFIILSFLSNYIDLELHVAFIIIFNFYSVFVLAFIICYSVERICEDVGEMIGGLISATCGNIVEIFISFFSISKGQYDIVTYTILGSIISNTLFVQGSSYLLGCWKNKKMNLEKTNDNLPQANLFLFILCLIIKIIYDSYDKDILKIQITTSLNETQKNDEINDLKNLQTKNINLLSLIFSTISIILYILLFISSVRKGKKEKDDIESNKEINQQNDENEDNKKSISLYLAIILLLISIVLEAFVSDFLTTSLGLDIGPKKFLVVIVFGIIGNFPEHNTALIQAYKDKPYFTYISSYGSVVQITLLLFPSCVIFSNIIGKYFTLLVSEIDLVLLAICVIVPVLIMLDKKVNWIESVILCKFFIIFAIVYYFGF